MNAPKLKRAKTLRLLRSAWSAEALEPRRLLAVFNGTSGNDVMEVTYNGLAYQFTLNGQPAGTSSDSSITLQGLAGNDQIRVLKLKPGTGQAITVRGGTGDDAVRVASGNLIRDIDSGRVVIEELAGEGNDSLFVDDNGTVGAHAPLDVSNASYTASLLDDTSVIEFDSNTELKQFNFSSQNDFARVSSVPVGMSLMMGDGNNTVIYGGTSLIIEVNPPAGHVEGGAGTNLVIFDDRNASSAGAREYQITSSGLTNQTFTNVDDLELVVRYGDVSGNLISVLDDANILREIRVLTGTEFGAGNDLQLGSQSSPVDLDTFAPDLFVDIDVFGISNYALWEQSPNVGNDAFLLTTVSGNQVVSKNTFQATFTSDGSGFDLRLNGGSASDSFAIDAVLPESRVFIDGNSGDDTVFQAISGGQPTALDVNFRGELFFFDGGDGDDRLLLDDSEAAVGAGSSTYVLNASVSKDGHGYVSTDFVEEITINADAGNNTIRFATEIFPFAGLPTRYQIRAGPGNDLVTNKTNTSFNSEFRRVIDVTVLGQGGNDTLDLDDTLNTTFSGRAFSISATQFRFQPTLFGVGSITYDGTLERLDFTDGDLGSDVVLSGKNAGASVSINLGGGDDEITVGGGDLDSSGLLSSSVTIGGALGNDSIVFDDRLDSSGDGTTSVITMTNNALAKGAPTLFYGSFDFQTLLAANFVAPGQLEVVPVVNLNEIAAGYNETTITGGANRGCIVNVGDASANNLNSIAGLVTVRNATSLTVNDTNNTTGTGVTYEITNARVSKPSATKIINYTAVGAIVLNASNQASTISVTSVPAGVPVTVNANGGNDAITFGNGNISSDILGPVTLNGGAGSNALTINNASDSNLADQTLTTTTFADTLTHNHSGMTSLVVNEGAGGSNLAVNSVNIPATINGGSGNDVISVGNGNLNNNFLANITVNGGAGADQLNILDQLATGGRSHSFPTVTLYRLGAVDTGKTITFGTIEAASLQCGSGNDTVDVAVANVPVTVHTGGEFTPVGGFTAGDSLTVGSFLGPATVILGGNDTVLNLTVGGVLRIPAGVVLNRVAPTFDFNGLNLSGTIDIAGALLWRGGGATPDFRTFLSRGHNSGTWNGTSPSGSINSSAANLSAQSDGIGYGLGSEIAVTTIGGFTIAPGDTLLRYTLDGDADLNQSVNFDDLLRLAQHYNQTGSVWSRGDFDYNAAVDFSDLLKLAQNYSRTLLANAGLRRVNRESLFNDVLM